MMDQDLSEMEYITGFNEGYLISHHLPELAQKLSYIDRIAPRIDGFKDGRQQYALDHLKEQKQLWAQRESGYKPDIQKEQNRDIDLDRN